MTTPAISGDVAGGLWRDRRVQVLRRDGWRCVLCGRHKRLTVHHIRPAALGRDDRPSNLVTLCRGCHDDLERGVARRLSWVLPVAVWVYGVAVLRLRKRRGA